MRKSEKERLVSELADRLKQTETLIVADYRGLKMTEIDRLRGELLKHGASFRVVKNTLGRIAAKEAGNDALLALLEGPTAIAFLESEGDPVAVAKALSDSARTTRILTIRGGVLEGKPISGEDVGELAKLPPLEILRGQVMGAVIAPLNQLLALVNAPLQNLYGLIDARIEQLEAAGEAPPAAESEAPVEPEAAAEPEAVVAEPEAVAEAAPEESTEEADAEASPSESQEEE